MIGGTTNAKPKGGYPMFDNPNKELERLQQELLDAEKQPEDYYTDEDLEADLEDPSEWEGDDRAPLSQSYTGVTDDTQLWGLDPEPEEPPAEPEKPEKPRFVGLKFAIALELLGIAALFWWWYLWIR